MRTEVIQCDLCQQRDPILPGYHIQVIFTTDQDEGRATQPYLDSVKIDLCQKCLDHVLAGNYIFAEGAMGYNRYRFKTAPPGERISESQKQAEIKQILDATNAKLPTDKVPPESIFLTGDFSANNYESRIKRGRKPKSHEQTKETSE